MIPESLLYTKLTSLFPVDQIGPGPIVYNASGDPIPPFVTYRRTNTDETRDLQGNLAAQLVDFDVDISSKFFDELDVDLSSLDNWLVSGWYFNVSNQTINNEQFSITVSLTAAKAF